MVECSVQLAAQCVAAFHKSNTNIMAIANCDYAGRAIHGHVVERLVARPTVRRLGVPRSWQTAAATIATKTIVREPLQAGSQAAWQPLRVL